MVQTLTRIMIVEDDSLSARNLGRLLSAGRYTVAAVAESGEAAIVAASREKPDLILMDVNLSGEIDGIAAAESIQAENDIPVIFLTALKDPETFFRANDSHAYAYLVKPIDFDDLERCIELTLSQHAYNCKLRERERRVRINAQNLRTLLKTIPDLIVKIRNDGTILDYHAPLSGEFSFISSNMVSKNIVEVLSELNAPININHVREWMSLETPQICFKLVIQGATRFFEARLVRCEAQDAIAIVRDITDRTRSEERIRRYMNDLEASRDYIAAQAEELATAHNLAESANRAKSDFLATMSHEMRTPLNSIIGMAELLRNMHLSEQQRPFMEGIAASAENMLEIINDVLDVAKVEAGHLEIKPAQFNLRTVCEDVLDMLAPKIFGTGVELVLRFPPRTPEYLVADAGRIRQILVNLVGNAIKWTRQGCISLEVDCDDCSAQMANIRIKVTDTGIGIESEKLQQLFQKFYQIDTPEGHRPAGTGLGLAISRNLVEMMNGEIGVNSIPGAGSSFWFTLPLPLDTSRHRQTRQQQNLAGIRVLIVDDLSQSRDMLKECLTACGMRCALATSAQEALTVIREACRAGDPVRIALIDQSLPDMDGMHLAMAIHADATLGKLHLVHLAAAPGNEDDAAEPQVAVFSAVLAKPVRSKRLMDVLQTVAFCADAEAAVCHGNHLSVDICDDQEPTVSSVAEESFTAVRALVVEDNPGSRLVAATMLEQLGCKTDVATNGREALALVATTTYDIIFMDCNMPDMNGFDATTEIRRREHGKKRTVIIALTANAVKGYREKCLAAGMDDFLSKPVRSYEIRSLVQSWTGCQPELPAEVQSQPVAPVAVRAEDVFETPRLQELLLMFRTAGKDFFQDVIEPYLKNAEERIPALREALVDNNFSGVCDMAHYLRGGSRSLGLRTMSEVCSKLMETATANEHDKVRTFAGQLEKELPLLRQQVYDLRERGVI